MSDYITTTFPFKGKEHTLKILSGTVIDTETRSDTYVSGSGSSSSHGGYGRGGMSISSKVVVTKDVWIRGLLDKEERFQLGDYAIRAGNVVHLALLPHKENVDGEVVFLYNRTTDQAWFIGDNNFTLADTPVSYWVKTGLASIVGTYLFMSWLLADEKKVSSFSEFAMGFGISFVIFIILSMIFGSIFGESSKSIKTAFKADLKEKFWSMKTQMSEVAEQIKNAAAPVNAAVSPTSVANAFCSSCGKSQVPDAKFCAGCGNQLAAVAS